MGIVIKSISSLAHYEEPHTRIIATPRLSICILIISINREALDVNTYTKKISIFDEI